MSQTSENLGRRATRGAGVMMATQLVRFALQIGSIAVLSRLLTPAQVGLVAMVTAVLNVAEIIRDFGLSSAAIQAPTLSKAQRSNLFWLNLGIGSVCSVLAAASAPALAWTYGRPELVPIVLALAGIFILSGANTQYRADLSRDLRFKALAVTDIGAQALSIAAAITAAALGAGYWAIVIQQLTMAIVSLISNALQCRWLPGRPRRDVPMRKFITFGSHLLGSNLLGYAVNNVDNIGVGLVWGPGPLGLYNRAYQLLQQPLQQITAPLFRVVLPVLSRVQDDETAYLHFFRRFQVAACYTLGLGFAILAGIAVPVTDVLLGASWSGVAPILTVLAVGGVFKGMDSTSYYIWVSKNITGKLFRFYLVSRPLMILVILAGLPWGPVGVAVGHLVAAIANWLISTRLACRYAGLPARALIGRPAKILTMAVLPAGGAAYAASLLPLPALVQAAAGLAAGLVCAGALSLLIGPLRRELVPLVQLAVRAARRLPHTSP